MHRMIMQAPKGVEVDHINGNGLDNRRENLRLATRHENCRNARKQQGCSSRYRGVSWYKTKQRWESRLNFNGRLYHLGYHDDEEDAARIYDNKARELFGDFVTVNFPEPGERSALEKK